jgi:hypothetical protein
MVSRTIANPFAACDPLAVVAVSFRGEVAFVVIVILVVCYKPAQSKA